MNDLWFVAIGFSIVGALCLWIWFDHKDKKADQKRGKVLEMRQGPLDPYFNDSEKQKMYWL